jgi:hypothetical protein
MIKNIFVLVFKDEILYVFRYFMITIILFKVWYQ